jgi:hypothetical protein
MDEHYKIVKLTVPGSNVEVLRDFGHQDVSMGAALETAPQN